jgi:hypothetical protein
MLPATLVAAAALGLALGSLAPPADAAVRPAMPKEIDPAGQPLALQSCGIRQLFWMRFYSVGLYLAPGAPLEAALDPRAPAALRLQVLDVNHFPSQVPEKWARALAASLSPEQMARVRRAYRGLSDGDLLDLIYLPGQGARLSINGQVIARSRGHDVIAKMLDVWAGNDPVTGKLRRIALQHPC